ncbi:MAG: hypothetical protein VX278_00640, partial [Myxococcota bacterium]|nr:hypothetical protein [Myxococcota bacterium]
MWYTAEQDSGGFKKSIGYAVSSNGTEWTSHPSNPLLAVDPTGWDQDSIASQVIVWDPIDTQYIMAYQGFTVGGTWGLGIATSPDGVSWTKSAQNPALNFNDYSYTEDDLWSYFCNDFVEDRTICDYYGISYSSSYEPVVGVQPCWPLTITISDRGLLRGYIAGTDTRRAIETAFDWAQLEADLWAELTTGAEVSLNTSDEPAACQVYAMDGVDANTWYIDENAPVLPSTETYDASGIASAAVVEYTDEETQDKKLYMFYVGFEEWVIYDSYQSSSKQTLNLATSTDGGVTWQKDPNNPIPINLTTPGQISDIGAQVIGKRIHIWVTDVYGSSSAVGYFYYEPGIDPHP